MIILIPGASKTEMRGPSMAETPESSTSTDAKSSTSEQKTLALFSRPEAPALWVDHVRFSMRHDAPIVTLTFLHVVPDMTDPEGHQVGGEAARVVMTHTLLKKMVDVACRILNYTP